MKKDNSAGCDSRTVVRRHLIQLIKSYKSGLDVDSIPRDPNVNQHVLKLLFNRLSENDKLIEFCAGGGGVSGDGGGCVVAGAVVGGSSNGGFKNELSNWRFATATATAATVAIAVIAVMVVMLWGSSDCLSTIS